jgi:hypothetical protein
VREIETAAGGELENRFADLGARLSRKIKQDVYSQLQRELDMDGRD